MPEQELFYHQLMLVANCDKLFVTWVLDVNMFKLVLATQKSRTGGFCPMQSPIVRAAGGILTLPQAFLLPVSLPIKRRKPLSLPRNHPIPIQIELIPVFNHLGSFLYK